jgi:hypothetical protein
MAFSFRSEMVLPRAMMILCTLPGLLPAAHRATGAERVLKHSDVVFMGAREKAIYEVYGATVVSWGGMAWNDDAKSISSFRKRVEDAHDLGMQYSSGVAFRTAFARMIDFDSQWRDSLCLNIEGKPITIPWLWDHKHKDGHPAYWFCTNAPGYQAYLKWQVKMAMTVNVEGLHIDDYNGTAGTEWHGCCFCKHCMKAFTEYLKKNVSAERLQSCGIASLDGFDYGEFLKSKGIATVGQFRRILNSPAHLGPDYVRFQYFASAGFVEEARKYGEQLVGHTLLLSVNSSASDPKSLVIAPYLSYFCGEVNHGAERTPWGPQANHDLEPVWTFKLADAVGVPQACTGSGRNWAYIDANKKPGLVRRWIAQDYAFGHCLMAPHRQWAFTKEKGTHWYQSQPEDYAHVYRFIRRNSDLFDDYEAVGLVGLLYSNAGARKSIADAREACLWLAKNSIPFEMVLAGDEWLDATLTPQTLNKYRALIVAEPTLLEGVQKQAVDTIAQAGKVLAWDAKQGIDEAALSRLLPKSIRFEGNDNLIGVARVKPAHPKAPVVLHLLNRNYDEAADATTKVKNIKVTLDKNLFGGRSFAKATLHAPPPALDPQNPGASEPLALRVEPTDHGTVISVPELDYWAIVKLE